MSDIETRGPAIVKVAIISPCIAAPFVFLRLWTRIHLAKCAGWDDLIAGLTLLACIGYSVLIIEAVNIGGMGRHIYDFTPELESEYYKWIAISSELYLLALMGYKMTILMTYHKIFSVSRRFKYTCWGVMFFTVGYLLSNMITEVAGCHPIELFWTIPRPAEGCINFLAADITYGAMNVISDFAIALLPIRLVWNLNVNRREKIGLMIVLSSGVIAFVVALIRWIIGCVDLTAKDGSWIAGLTFLWSVLEVNTGLICACCLPLKPLLNVARDAPVLNKLFHSTRRSSRKPSASNGTTFSAFEKRNVWLGAGRKHSDGSREPVLDSIDREIRGPSIV